MNTTAVYLEWGKRPEVRACGKPGPRYWVESIGWGAVVQLLSEGGPDVLTKHFIDWHKSKR